MNGDRVFVELHYWLNASAVGVVMLSIVMPSVLLSMATLLVALLLYFAAFQIKQHFAKTNPNLARDMRFPGGPGS